jgi:hypothetical protein
MKKADDGGWSPYLAGGLSGVALVLSVLVSGQFFGTSTTFGRAAGFVERLFAPDHVAQAEYFVRFAPAIDWQWMFVVGIALGAFLSAITDGSFRLKAVPEMWRSRFGPSVSRRAFFAFMGGAVGLFGARLAGG